MILDIDEAVLAMIVRLQAKGLNVHLQSLPWENSELD